jgi:hypothetical protein
LKPIVNAKALWSCRLSASRFDECTGREVIDDRTLARRKPLCALAAWPANAHATKKDLLGFRHMAD